MCGLVVAFVVGSLDLALVTGALFDTSTADGKSANSSWLSLGFLAMVVGFTWLFGRARRVRRIFGRMFLALSLAVLAFPIATGFFSVAFTRRQTDVFAGAGAAAGGTALTIGIALVSFFAGAILLVLARVLLGGGEQGPRLTKKCPACAEEVLAEAKICRFCRHAFEPQGVGAPAS